VRWRNRRRREARDEDELAPGNGISLRLSDAFEVGKVRDLSKLFAALAEAVPEDALLYLEGTDIAPEVADFVAAQSVEPTALVMRGTMWPESQKFHLPATSENLLALHELALRHAEPELCDHLVVYVREQVLISAYDAGFEIVYAHRSLAPAAIDRLREAAED
jgi:hypothetical protein